MKINNIALLYLVVFTATSICMDNLVLLKTSDNKQAYLPQWKIENSRLLHIKHQWHLFKEKYDKTKSAGIILKTIDSNQLHLFSNALDAQDFPDYFNTLSPENKRSLICAAGKQELDAPCLTIKLAYASFIPDIIECINSNIETVDITNYLKYLVILDNCKHKNFVQTKNSYANAPCIVPTYDGYHYLPNLLERKTNFSGATFPITAPLYPETKDLWPIVNTTNHSREAGYFLTSKLDNEKQWRIKSNKIILRAGIRKNNTFIEKVIKHKNIIEFSSFSKDGKYLATASEGIEGELILTDLSIQDNKFIVADVFLTGFTEEIDWISFNNSSTLLTALSNKKLFFWNIKTGELVTVFDIFSQELQQEINCISFNRNDSRLVIGYFDPVTQASTAMLLDLSDIMKVKSIKYIVMNDVYICTAEFNPAGDKLIIGTDKSIVLLDTQSGDIIMTTGILQQEPDSPHTWVRAVLMQHIPILATSTHNSSKECNVALWDINSGECISTLSEKEKELVGIGVTHNDQQVVSITPSYEMIKTELYNDTIESCLKWTFEKMSLFQKYLLLRLYRACKLNDTVDLHDASPEAYVLQNLPVEPVNIKEFVEKYLYTSNELFKK